MKNPEKIELAYKDIISKLSKYIPDGIIKVDLNFLESEGLLYPNQEEIFPIKGNSSLQFHIMESEEKVTLFNNKFTVWIIPTIIDSQTGTLTIIGHYKSINGKNKNDETPEIELGFSTSGMYNTSKVILKIVEYFIKNIESNEQEVNELKI